MNQRATAYLHDHPKNGKDLSFQQITPADRKYGYSETPLFTSDDVEKALKADRIRSATIAKKLLEVSEGYSWEEAGEIYHAIVGEDNGAYTQEMTEAFTASQQSEALLREVTFLLDRLDEYEAVLEDTTDFQEYFGHVHASKSRLRSMTEAQ